MPRIVSERELDLIAWVISEHPHGIGISMLEETLVRHLPKSLNRRTLQRRLERLIADKRIRTEGESIALVYKSVPQVITGRSKEGITLLDHAEAETYIPVSSEGAIIRDFLRRPLMHRKPVGYQRVFLDDYIPGNSFYLSRSLRAQLHEIGRAPGDKSPAGTYARQILDRLLIDLSWASSRLEGNTYNRLDTRNLIEFGQSAEGKDLQETQMILNHKAAIEMLIEEADQVGFSPFTFFNLHAILSENLLPDENACGRLRRRPVNISGSVFHPLAMPQALEDCFRLLLRKAADIPDPFEQAFFVMVQLPYLQPFEDVNKRVSRLGANIPLIKNNLCPLSFIDVPEQAYLDGTLGVYELNQVDLLMDVFIWAYERSCQQYLAITKKVAEPDPLRIRYREALIQAVQTIVKDLQTPSPGNVERLGEALAPEKDRDAFCKILRDVLRHLHEGNVVRYRLKLSDFQIWEPIQKRYQGQRKHP